MSPSFLVPNESQPLFPSPASHPCIENCRILLWGANFSLSLKVGGGNTFLRLQNREMYLFFFLQKKLHDEEEEVSELQLRLLALQSASKKWQQKEQQVMKESKEKLTKAKTVQQKVKTSTKSHSAKKTSNAGK